MASDFSTKKVANETEKSTDSELQEVVVENQNSSLELNLMDVKDSL